MKTLLLVAFFAFLYLSCYAQPKTIDGFLGIKFGSSKEAVLAAMKARGAILDQTKSVNDVQRYDNVTIGTRKVDVFFVKFIDNQAFQANFYFLAPKEVKTIDLYNDIISEINDVYGGGKSYKTFKKPYEDGDGYELTAIKTGNAEYSTYWSNDANENTISLTINSVPSVDLEYQDSKLVKIAIDKQKEKARADY